LSKKNTHYRCIIEPLPQQRRSATPAATVYPESSQSRTVMAIGMLCVPLVSFGSVLALYLILTV
jgi:hypothetical protein